MIIDKIKRNEFYRNLFVLLSGNGIAQVIPLLVYPVIARLYTPNEFGDLALITSIHAVVLILTTFRYEQAIIIPSLDSSANKLFNTGLSITLIVSTVFLLLNFIIGERIIESLQIDLDYRWLYFIGLTVLAGGFMLMFTGWNTRYKYFNNIIIYTLLLSLLTSILKVTLGIFNIENGLIISFITAYIISSVVFFLISMGKKSISPLIKFLQKKDYLYAKEYINFPKYNMPHVLLNSFSSHLPVFLITAFFSEYYTGQYSVAFLLLMKPVHVFSSSASGVLSQKIASSKNEKKNILPDLKKFLIRTAILVISIALPLFVFVPNIIEVVLGEQWKYAGKICQILLPWIILLGVISPLSSIPDIFNLQKYALKIEVLYILGRTASILTAVLINDLLVGMMLLSGVGILTALYRLFWYVSIIQKNT